MHPEVNHVMSCMRFGIKCREVVELDFVSGVLPSTMAARAHSYSTSVHLGIDQKCSFLRFSTVFLSPPDRSQKLPCQLSTHFFLGDPRWEADLKVGRQRVDVGLVHLAQLQQFQVGVFQNAKHVQPTPQWPLSPNTVWVC